MGFNSGFKGLKLSMKAVFHIENDGAIIFVGHVLHTKMKGFVKAMNQKTWFSAFATEVFTDQ